MEKHKLRHIVGMFQSGKGFIAVEYTSGKVKISNWGNKKALAACTDEAAQTTKATNDK